MAEFQARVARKLIMQNWYWVENQTQKLEEEIDKYVGALDRPQRKYLWGRVNEIVKVINESIQMCYLHDKPPFLIRFPWKLFGDGFKEERKKVIILVTDQYLYRTPSTPSRKKKQEENDIRGVVALAHKLRNDQEEERRKEEEERMKANKVGLINPYIICKID